MIDPQPVLIHGRGIRLEPMSADHVDGIFEAASDGELWNLWFTGVPGPHRSDVEAWVATAHAGQAAGHMLPWVVVDEDSDRVVGSTRYHDVVPAIDRVEIGHTFYGASHQRTHVNTTCKLLLLAHAFDTLDCAVVGLRTDGLNFRSQRAIEGIGAKRDGVIRHHAARRDGSVRDSVMFSILQHEWPDVRRHLEFRLSRFRS
jgi:N-acetyltransferase